MKTKTLKKIGQQLKRHDPIKPVMQRIVFDDKIATYADGVKLVQIPHEATPGERVHVEYIEIQKLVSAPDATIRSDSDNQIINLSARKDLIQPLATIRDDDEGQYPQYEPIIQGAREREPLASIRLNPKQLRDILDVIISEGGNYGDDVVLHLSEKAHPVVIESSIGVRALLMPMKWVEDKQ